VPLFNRKTPEEKAQEKVARQEFDAAFAEFKRERDKAFGTSWNTSWPKCMSCGHKDGWGPVGDVRHVRAPTYSKWWNGGSSTIATQRFKCVHCSARADLVRTKSGFEFLNG